MAGCSVAAPKPDDDRIDWALSRRLAPRRPKPDLQVHSTINSTGTEAAIHNPLERKNYDELAPCSLLAPRLLVVVIVPREPTEWVTASPEALLLCHYGYRVSLRKDEPMNCRNCRGKRCCGLSGGLDLP